MISRKFSFCLTFVLVISVVNGNVSLVCKTRECKQFALNLRTNMNTSINPCDNFYDYVCGSWPKNNPIPQGEGRFGPAEVIDKTVRKQLKGVLEDAAWHDYPPMQLVKRWYDSCMDTDKLERDGLQPLLRVLDSNCGWPILRDSQTFPQKVLCCSKKCDWQQVNAFYAFYGISSIYEITVNLDPIQSDARSVQLTPSENFPFPRLTDSASSKGYEFYVNLIVEVVGSINKVTKRTLSKEKVIADAKDIVKFHQNLEHIIHHSYANQNSSIISIMPIYLLQEWYDIERNASGWKSPTSKINWLWSIRHLLKKVNIELDTDTDIVVENKVTFLALGKLLDATPVATIVNFIHWNFVSTVMKYSYAKFVNLDHTATFLQFGVQEMKPRWETCIYHIEPKHIIAYAYVKKHWHATTSVIIRNMMQIILNIMSKNVEKSTYISGGAKTFIVTKLRYILSLFGYPEWYDTPLEIENRFKDLEIGSEYLTNYLNYQRHQFMYTLRLLRKRAERFEWIRSPLESSAFYNPSTNALTVPAAMMQTYIYSTQLAPAAVYGTLGYVLGHEMAHSFDFQGRNHDHLGNTIGWLSEIWDTYNKRVECFSSQYRKYNAGKKKAWKVDSFSLAEDIADNIGNQVAYDAFKMLSEKDAVTQGTRIAGIEHFNANQLFFLSFAHMSCESMLPECAEKYLELDEHSLGKYRVIGSLSNSLAFAKAFNCPPGAPMNPVRKCGMW